MLFSWKSVTSVGIPFIINAGVDVRILIKTLAEKLIPFFSYINVEQFTFLLYIANNLLKVFTGSFSRIKIGE